MPSPWKPSAPPRPVVSAHVLSLVALFGLGLILGMLLMIGLENHLHSPEGSPGLRLPDEFAVYPSDWWGGIGRADQATLYGTKDIDGAELSGAVWITRNDSGSPTVLSYGTLRDMLATAKISSSADSHKLEIVNWEKLPVFSVELKDGGDGSIRVSDAAGKLLATGHQDPDSHTIKLFSDEGLSLAVISPEAQRQQWRVAISHYSKITPTVYVLLASYELAHNARQTGSR